MTSFILSGRLREVMLATHGPSAALRREHDFPQPAGKDERAERRGDPPVQRHEGGETWVHIGNPGYILVRGREECVTAMSPSADCSTCGPTPVREATS